MSIAWAGLMFQSAYKLQTPFQAIIGQQRTRCTARRAGTCSNNLFHHLVGISENSTEIDIFKVLISREPVPDLILVINHALPQDKSNWNVVDVLIKNKKG